MTGTTSLEDVEERLNALLDRYRPKLVDGTIYGIPALVWPNTAGHDYFAALNRGKTKVGLYLIIADRYPNDLALASEGLRSAHRTGDFLVLVAGRGHGGRSRQAGWIDCMCGIWQSTSDSEGLGRSIDW